MEKLANVHADSEEAKGEKEDEFQDSSDHVVEDTSRENFKGEAGLVQEEAPLEATVEQLLKDEGKEGEEKLESAIPEEAFEGKSKKSSSPESVEGLEKVDKEVAHDTAVRMEGSETDEHLQVVLDGIDKKQTKAPVGEETSESNSADANGDFGDPVQNEFGEPEMVRDQGTYEVHEDEVETGVEHGQESAQEVLTEGFSEEDISGTLKYHVKISYCLKYD